MLCALSCAWCWGPQLLQMACKEATKYSLFCGELLFGNGFDPHLLFSKAPFQVLFCYGPPFLATAILFGRFLATFVLFVHFLSMIDLASLPRIGAAPRFIITLPSHKMLVCILVLNFCSSGSFSLSFQLSLSRFQ